MSGIVAGIVTFEPDLERLSQNVKAVASQVSHVFVFDNGSSNITEVAALLDTIPGAELLRSPSNVGIAAALNRLAEAAEGRHADRIVTLDQDSVCSPGMVEALDRQLAGRVGMSTPFIVDRNKMSLEAHAAMSLPEIERYRQPARRGAITSGALVLLQAWREAGGFDERFFIDYVDYDFNQRLMASGWQIVRVNAATLLHEVGKASPTWLFVPRRGMSGGWRLERFYAFGHSAERCYFKARNRILFTRKHGRALGITHEGVWQLPQQIALTVLFERDRAAKLASFMRGVRDGLALKM